MCEYCNKENKKELLRGDDGIYFDQMNNQHLLYIEHFRNEVYEIEVDYCPKCGKHLKYE